MLDAEKLVRLVEVVSTSEKTRTEARCSALFVTRCPIEILVGVLLSSVHVKLERICAKVSIHCNLGLPRVK